MNHLIATSTLILVLAGSSARAEDPLPVQLDHTPWLGFQLRFGFPQTGDSDTSFTLVSPRLDTLIPVGDSGAIALQWPMAYLTGEGDSRFVIGNVFVGYAFNPRPTLRFTPGLVLPLAQISNDDPSAALEQAVTYIIAASAAAGHDLWLYAPEAFSIVAPLHANQRLSDMVTLDMDAALAIIFPNEGDTEIVLDSEIAMRVSVLRIGLGAVVLLTSDSDDRAIVSGVIGVRVPVGGGEIRADLLVTLDDPALFSDGAIPSVTVGYATSL